MQQGGRARQGSSAPPGFSQAGPSSGSGGGGRGGEEAGDREWLKGQLVRMLQWDPFAAEGVVSAVEASQSQQEVEELIEGFCGGSIPVKQAALRFWQAQRAAPAGAHAYQKGDGIPRVAGGPAAASSSSGGNSGGRGGGLGGTAGGGRAGSNSGGVELPPPSQPVAAKDGAKVLDMGINIRTTVKKGKGAAGGGKGGGALTAARLERPVVNCLRCGKIFDCRAVTNEIIQFLESGGVCTFCGNQVDLRCADGSAVEPRAAAAATAAPAAEAGTQPPTSKGAGAAGPAAAGAAGAGAQGAGADSGPAPAAGAGAGAGRQEGARALTEAEQAALELKNRLVEYDRNSAKRTTVIDDQSDFFEIDSNAWLNDEERKQLKERQREIAAAEEARRRRVTVTFDLLGRRVLMADEAQEAAAEVAARSAAAEAAMKAARATAEEAPQGGGSAARAALERAEETLRTLRITVNPSLAAANYVFLPGPAGDKSKVSKGRSEVSNGGGAGAEPAAFSGSRDMPAAHAVHGGGGGGAGGGGRGRRPRQAPGAPARLQHDDPFELDLETAIEVLAEDEASRMALEASLDEADSGPFDICPPLAAATMRPLGPPGGKGAAGGRGGRALPRVEVLQEGMVLLRGWLSIAQQAQIVGSVRVLGLGPGGFYTPSYSSGGQLSLKMMCLGWHWEPRTASYEKIRSSHDGATPPPIPPPLLDLAQRCVAEAQAAPGVGALPGIKPDICLANFYEKQGRLGLHQDKDESAESLRAGIPVVSFSIGDAADFAYGPSRDEERCAVVRLESGDALVFGGAARMLYHAVRAVHPGTAPQELLAKTGLRPGRLNLTFRQR